jgi:hypothetical protein
MCGGHNGYLVFESVSQKPNSVIKPKPTDRGTITVTSELFLKVVLMIPRIGFRVPPIKNCSRRPTDQGQANAWDYEQSTNIVYTFDAFLPRYAFRVLQTINSVHLHVQPETHLRRMVPNCETYQGDELGHQTSPVDVFPIVIIVDCISSNHRPDNNNDKDKAIAYCDSNMSIFIWHEFHRPISIICLEEKGLERQVPGIEHIAI